MTTSHNYERNADNARIRIRLRMDLTPQEKTIACGCIKNMRLTLDTETDVIADEKTGETLDEIIASVLTIVR